jgi:hypothetical protein
MLRFCWHGKTLLLYRFGVKGMQFLGDFKGFWLWCITLVIAGFFDFVYRPVFWEKLENSTLRNLDLFRPSGDGGGTYFVGSHTKCLLHARPIRAANPVLKLLPSGFLLSAMILLIHRKYQYDFRDSSCVSVTFYFPGFNFIPQIIPHLHAYVA